MIVWDLLYCNITSCVLYDCVIISIKKGYQFLPVNNQFLSMEILWKLNDETCENLPIKTLKKLSKDSNKT